MIQYIKGENCSGCGRCVNACPLDVLRLNEEKTAYIKYPNDCMSCYNCEWDCPEEGTIFVSPKRATWVQLPW